MAATESKMEVEMQYIITFLEGILSFISPCMLPMLPIYLSYFMGERAGSNKRTLINAASFVLGFSFVFSILGFFAGTVSILVREHQTIVNFIGGAVIILFGLSYLGVIRFFFFKGNSKKIKISGAFSAFVFGMIYSIHLTPCVGAFLGAALTMASTTGSSVQGLLLLIVYSLGMGIPFVLTAVLIEKMRNLFGWIKSHYLIIERISGGFLVCIGVLMATGLLSRFTALFNF